MSFILQKAIREKKQILFSICGGSGSGKTNSSLILARGISGEKGKIVVIDCDYERSSEYGMMEGEQENISKGIFDFDKIIFDPPYTPERYIAAIKEALTVKPDVIIIDTITNVWAGEGGILESVTDSGDTGLSSWKIPKRQHEKLFDFIRKSKCHFIFCVFAKDKKTYVKNNLGKREVVDKGYTPICEGDMMRMMSGFVILHPKSPGVVSYQFDKKLNDQLQLIFEDKKLINLETGRKLKEWANNGCDKILSIFNGIIKVLNDAEYINKLQALTSHHKILKGREFLKQERPDLDQKITDLIAQKHNEFEGVEHDV